MFNLLMTSVIMVASILGLMAGLTRALNSNAIHGELARKLLHIGVGICALALPNIYVSSQSVFGVLAAGFAILLHIRRYPLRFSAVAGPLQCIERQSTGDLWFLAGIALVYGFTLGTGPAYFGAILILMLADTSAALIGSRFGKFRYSVLGCHRSFEGSSAFFVVAWGCASSVLFVAATPSPYLAGAVVALATSVTEALSPNGSDNFTVPLVAWLCLHILESAYT